MSLQFLTRKPVKVSTKPGFSWDAWYSQNKQRLCDKKARRYREDVAYREKALERSRSQREEKKDLVTDGYTIPFNEMARQLGLTVWVLREWRKKDYFPEPCHREGRLWFKENHVKLLQSLNVFFREKGPRMVASKKDALDNVVGWVYSNW